ncbi:hypothetical protein F4859DRAFT_481441 [Xylaria cf. heliscus]|nr:hypothetical protein F4859DRAFT_481441 [Xylaria cf. heliscus]
MQVTTFFLATALLSLGTASIIPAIHGPTLVSAYTRRASPDMNAVFEPQHFADVQTDRRKALGETS